MAFTFNKVATKSESLNNNQDNQKKINCIISSFIYKDDESGFFVFSATLPMKQEEMNEKINGKLYKGRTITVVGTSMLLTKSIAEGQEIEVWGKYEAGKKDSTIQFTATALQEVIPLKAKDIEIFLASGKIYGIGPKTAKNIVLKHKENTLKILDSNPDILLEINGINEKKVEMIKKSWKDWRQIYTVVAKMRTYGIGDSAALKIQDFFKEKSIEIITKDPYRLTEVPSIGFRTADKIAQSIGISVNDKQRIEKCILYTLEQSAEKGHTVYPKDDLSYHSNEILKLDPNIINNAIEDLINKELIIKKNISILTKGKNNESYYIIKEAVAHKKFYNTEKAIAKELKRIYTFPSLEGDNNTSEKISSFTKENPDKLVDSQMDAAKTILSNKVAVLTGGPGTGKTHTIKSLISYFDSIKKDVKVILNKELSSEYEIVLSAPTGRASKRMEELTKKKSSTIHRLLGFSEGTFLHNENNKLKGDVFIIDEFSMVDIYLMAALLKAIPSTARIIFVGDSDQLPSVGEGNVLKDVIDSAVIPVARFTAIRRQALGSNIIIAAHNIITNKMPPLEDINSNSDFVFVEQNGNEDIHNYIMELTAKLISSGVNESDIQILSPRKETEVGTHSLNSSMRGIMNNHFVHHQELTTKFVPGDRVMQFKNDREKDIYNGDVGVVLSVDEESGILDIVFDDKVIEFSGQSLNNLQLSYAITVHKSQGSDYPYVIIPMSKSHSFMWDTNLLYTAVTRGKNKVILVGEKQAIALSVSSFKQVERFTSLKDLIIEEFSMDNKPKNKL